MWVETVHSSAGLVKRDLVLYGPKHRGEQIFYPHLVPMAQVSNPASESPINET